MKITFILGQKSIKEIRQSIFKEFFYKTSGEMYAKMIRDHIFEMDNTEGLMAMEFYKKERRLMRNLMHEYIGEKGNIVIGLESYIGHQSKKIVLTELAAYIKRNYPDRIRR